MSKNKEVMSIAIKPELKVELIRYANRKGLSNSAYIGTLIEQAVKINIDDDPHVIGKPVDDDVQPVVLNIPKQYKDSPDKLKQWLDVQTAGIVKAMTKHLEA